MAGQKDSGGVLMVDIGGALGSLLAPLASFLGGIFSSVMAFIVFLIILLIAAFFITSKLNPLHLTVPKLKAAKIKWNPLAAR